jgi:hypothetical protein
MATPRWFARILADPDNYQLVQDALDYYQEQYEEAQKEIKPTRGTLLWNIAVNIPSTVEHRFGQLQEIEAILKLLEIKYEKLFVEKKRNFLEHYQRQLSPQVAGEFADVDIDVIAIRELIQTVALTRNLFQGIMKALEYMHFQMGNMVKLKQAMIEDVTF